MKLTALQHKYAYVFDLGFDGEWVFNVDLKPLVGAYIAEEELNTAAIDADWGCLVFKDGRVDVEPRTLYKFVLATHQSARNTQHKNYQPNLIPT
ncbi:MAG: hypothetical protein AB7S56_03345 [Halothiobacillaceae bacterium]